MKKSSLDTLENFHTSFVSLKFITTLKGHYKTKEFDTIYKLRKLIDIIELAILWSNRAEFCW